MIFVSRVSLTIVSLTIILKQISTQLDIFKCLILVLVCSFCTSCEQWGSPGYLKNVTSLPLDGSDLIGICAKDSFPDVYQMRVVRLSEKNSKHFLNPDPLFWQYPMPSEIDRDNNFLTEKWKTEEPIEKIKKEIEYLILGIRSSKSKNCVLEDNGYNFVDMMNSSLGEKYTHYAYKYKISYGKVKIRTFYFIDGKNGYYIEIIK